MAVMVLGYNAFADDTNNGVGPAWTCQLQGKMAGTSVGLIVSGLQLEGQGQIKCVSLNGVQTNVPVKLEMAGIGLGFGFTEYEEVEVATASFGLASGPEALAGSFAVGPTAGVTLINAGLDVGIAMRLSQVGGLSFELAFLGKKGRGLEAKVHLQSMTIAPLQ